MGLYQVYQQNHKKNQTPPKKTPKPMDFIPEVKVNCYKSWGKMYTVTSFYSKLSSWKTFQI